MNKLDLCPLQASYSVRYGASVERIALRGGFGRYVQTKDAKKHLVDVAFTLLEDDFIYFRAFYLNWQLNPLPFLMSLIIEDSDFREYIAQFVPDSFSFSELNGNVFKVSAQLVVVTNEVKILTSRPYPLFFIESMESSFSHDEVVSLQFSVEDEKVTTSFKVEEATLAQKLNSGTAPTETVSSIFAVNEASRISTITPVHNAKMNEEIKSAFSIDSSVANRTVIKYQDTEKIYIQSVFGIDEAIRG